MSLYKVSINNGNKRVIKHECELAWETAKQDVKTIRVLGICICVCLWVYVAFTAF